MVTQDLQLRLSLFVIKLPMRLTCLMLCVYDLSNFPILYPSISKEIGFLGEYEVEHRDYADLVISWII